MALLDLSTHRPGRESIPGQQKPDLNGAFKCNYPAGSTIFEPGDNRTRILLLVSGWATCTKILPNGTRIVVDFALRGDMISTMASDLSQESISALSDVCVYEFSSGLGGKDQELSPKLYQMVLVQMMKRQARLAERLANIGRRDALERTGHLFLELAIRAGNANRPELDGFECPLTQSDIGDAVGLSTVHINRILKDMRLNGLLSFRNGIVEFHNRNRLIELVDFDPDYLAQDTD